MVVAGWRLACMQWLKVAMDEMGPQMVLVERKEEDAIWAKEDDCCCWG